MEPQPHPQKDELLKGLRESYSDTVTRTGRFIVSTLIILFVLTVVVEQQIREYDARLRKQREIHAAANESVRKASARVSAASRALPDFIRSETAREKEGLVVGALPKLSLRMTQEKLARVVQRLDEYTTRLRPLIDERHKEEAAAQKKAEKGEAEGPQAAPSAKDSQARGPLHSSEVLSKAIDDLDKYKEAILARAAVVQKQEAAEKEMKDVATGKKSIPTPFGNFEVIPRLALLAIAFAILLTYLTTNAAIARARSFARRYSAVAGTGAVVSELVPAPPWLHGPEPDMERVLTWSRPRGPRQALAALFHGGWLALGWWVSAECLGRWHSTEALMFQYASLLNYALLVLLIVSTVVGLSNLTRIGLGGSTFSSLAPALRLDAPGGRRAFLRYWALGLTALAAGGAGYLFRPTRAARRQAPCAEAPGSGGDLDLVLNRRTKILHDESRCAKHLPGIKNRVKVSKAGAALTAGACLHSSKAASIWYDLAKQKIRTADEMRERVRWVEEEKREAAAAPGNASRRKARPGLGPKAVVVKEVAPAGWGEAPSKQEDETPEQLQKSADGNYEEAISHLKRAISLSPFSVHLYDLLVKLYGRQRRHGEIESLLKGAAQMVADEKKRVMNEVGIKGYGGRGAVKRLTHAGSTFDERLKSMYERKRVAKEYRAKKNS